MELICIIGLNSTGKTSTAFRLKEILEEQGNKVIVESFAAPLKTIAKMYCQYDEEKKNSEGHRSILESLAATMKKELSNVIFAYALLNRIRDSDAEYCIIDDLRYTHELATINEFYPVRIMLMPLPELAEQSDYNRLHTLLSFLEEYDAPYSKPEKITDDVLRNLISSGENLLV